MLARFLVHLFIYLITARFTLAQEYLTAAPKTEEVLFEIYQITNNNLNTYITHVTLIATVFGVFITGIVLFFAVKQLTADKEIREYNESVKKQKLRFEQATNAHIQEINKSSRFLKESEKAIDD